MRQDKVIFNGPNPFLEFAKCKELTVLLGQDKFVFVATMNSINMMATFSSIVKVFEGEEGKVQEAYTIPLSLVLPLFKLDTKEKENVLVLETTSDKVTITYNDVTIETDIFSPNGLTLQQVNNINTLESMEVNPAPLVQMLDVFGPTKDNFLNIDSKTLFISDESKCLITEGETDYKRKFSISIQFIRLMKSLGCTKLFIGENLVAQTKSGLWLISPITKITDPNVLKDYQFARRIKSDNIYSISINKYLKHIGLAVQSAELSASLDLKKRQLVITSMNNEKSILQLSDTEIQKEGAFDFFNESSDKDEVVLLTDARLIKSLASFQKVRIKVCPGFLLAKLGETHKLMFTLGRN